MKRRSSKPHRGSIYVAVAGASLLIALIGLTAAYTARIEVHAAEAQQHLLHAQSLAVSSVELAVARIDDDDDWRSNYSHGATTTISPTGTNDKFRFRFLDEQDGDLADDVADPITIHGIGQSGRSTFVYRTQCVSMPIEEGPIELQAFDSWDSKGNQSEMDIDRGSWIGQHFRVDLPEEAIDWKITQIDVMLKRDGDSTHLDLVLYEADNQGMPAAELQSVRIERQQMSRYSFNWVSSNFDVSRTASDSHDLCLGVTSEHGDRKAYAYFENDNVWRANSHLLIGKEDDGWKEKKSDESLWFRVRGTYTTLDGSQTELIPGSWQRVEAPGP